MKEEKHNPSVLPEQSLSQMNKKQQAEASSSKKIAEGSHKGFINRCLRGKKLL